MSHLLRCDAPPWGRLGKLGSRLTAQKSAPSTEPSKTLGKRCHVDNARLSRGRLNPLTCATARTSPPTQVASCRRCCRSARLRRISPKSSQSTTTTGLTRPGNKRETVAEAVTRVSLTTTSRDMSNLGSSESASFIQNAKGGRSGTARETPSLN
jgi:hypothetical protein